MASIPRLAAGSSSAEQVECCDDLITNILSRVSTRDALRMSTVSKRWKTLIFDPDFAHTHPTNCQRDSIFCLIDIQSVEEEEKFDTRTLLQLYQFCSYNSQTGNLSTGPFSWEGLDSSVQNGMFNLFAASNGLMFLYTHSPDADTPLWVYNPVRKFSIKLSMPFRMTIGWTYFAQICYIDNALKFVMAGYSFFESRNFTLVFDSRSNSWHDGAPLLKSPDYACPETQCFFNGVIYMLVGDSNYDDLELREVGDVDSFFIDEDDILYKIIGYDVNQDQWAFSILVPASVGCVYCLTEWEGNLLVCASNPTYEENLLELAASSSHDHNRIIRYSWDGCDGRFLFWILDTEHKLWIRERELDLSHHIHTSWTVSASGGVVWFLSGYNFVTVYDMKSRQFLTHRLDDAFASRQPKLQSFVSCEPTLLSL